MNTNNRPIFVSIETSAFSGATLLSFLLGIHPQIATVGEMDGLVTGENPDEYRCSCGQKIRECEFWQLIKAAMIDNGYEFDVPYFDTKFILNGPNYLQRLRVGTVGKGIDAVRDKLLFTIPGERHQLRALVDRNVAFVEAVLNITGKSVFVDTSKDRLRLKALHHLSKSFDIRAIHLVRDVRGVVASRLRRNKDSANISKLAKKWTRHHNSLDSYLKMLPEEKYIQLRYEDLCQNTESTLERIYDFCGVNPGNMIADFQTNSYHIIGNKMRLRPISEIKLDERWKSELTRDQLKEIDQVAGSLRRRYGYS